MGWILSVFSKQKTLASRHDRTFVSEGKNQPKPWSALKNQIFLGSDDFVDEMQRKVTPDKDLSEIATDQKRPVVKELSYYKKKYTKRDAAITAAYASGGYSMKELAITTNCIIRELVALLRQKNKT